jgi:CheY-like chemotaxis protein
VESETTSRARNAQTMTLPQARVLLADDHAVVREGLRAVLQAEGGIEVVVGEAGDGQEALEACRQLCPDVVLMDVRMPGMDGLEAYPDDDRSRRTSPVRLAPATGPQTTLVRRNPSLR